MGEVVRLISKSELERIRLIKEARAIYDRIFPSANPVASRGTPSGKLGSGHGL